MGAPAATSDVAAGKKVPDLYIGHSEFAEETFLRHIRYLFKSFPNHLNGKGNEADFHRVRQICSVVSATFLPLLHSGQARTRVRSFIPTSFLGPINAEARWSIVAASSGRILNPFLPYPGYSFNSLRHQ